MIKNSNITELLKGVEVEWKTLGEVAELRRGRVISKEDLAKNIGYYPVYSSQTAKNGEIGKINTFDFDGEFVNWTTDGANAGTVFYRKGKFSITNVSGLIKLNNSSKLNYKFLFYWLSIETKKHVYSGMGNPKLMSNQVEKIRIPIPPTFVQTEIVRILDTFTALTAKLTAELKAELTTRKKQYNYYRDKLLTFKEDEVEWKTLGEVGQLIRGNGLQKKDFTETGVPAIHYGQIYTYYGTFATETKSFVSAELAKKLKKAKYGDILLAGTSENVKDVMTPLGWLGGEIVFSGDMYAFRPNNLVNTKYLTYLLQTTHFQKFKEKYANGTKVIRIQSEKFLTFKIPIPPLKEQARIVEILDTFDALTNSITEGLPREIALRQKQYEYYRNLLLDFPKVQE
ncbi:type I restriction enzyme, S subunit [Gilliamella bombicola]|uniref:Type I restriction enzyme, S subunit n=1 Tax=Gilliamella bombicola TaxID=1798182 RepID=A0A1C4CJ04_9GAMM|nr:restriction endonuclease subunit S [Gilliamella bombicola]SCC19049.1 type I restriction enzyme, S subunit [Gilliamella bombicola]